MGQRKSGPNPENAHKFSEVSSLADVQLGKTRGPIAQAAAGATALPKWSCEIGRVVASLGVVFGGDPDTRAVEGR